MRVAWYSLSAVAHLLLRSPERTDLLPDALAVGRVGGWTRTSAASATTTLVGRTARFSAHAKAPHND
jgi:hypothetical protein